MYYYGGIIPSSIQEIQLKKISKDVSPENLLEIYNQLISLSTDVSTAKKYKKQICDLIS